MKKDPKRPYQVEVETTKDGAKRRTWRLVADAKSYDAAATALVALPDKAGHYRIRNGRETIATRDYLPNPAPRPSYVSPLLQRLAAKHREKVSA